MTEAEWLISTNAWALLECYGRTSERKDRLFLSACCRAQDCWIPDERVNAALDAAERRADELIADSTLRKRKHEMARLRNALPMSEAGASPTPAYRALALVVLTTTPFGSAGWQPVPVNVCFGISEGTFLPELASHLPPLLRDVFGNPFRPVRLDPLWVTSNVLAIASSIYQDRAFGCLPILADALLDAGCENEGVLSHLRSDGPHVRGCWALDLILGKS
jgi:hypothetical protein